MTIRAVVVEAWRTAVSTRAFSMLFAGLAAAVVCGITVLIAQVGAQRESVQEALEQERFRTVSLVDSHDKGVLSTQVRLRVGSLSSVARAWSSSAAFEVWNGALGDGARVSAHMVDADWATLPVTLTTGRLPVGPGEALAEDTSSALLGIDGTGGWVEDAVGRSWAIVGTFRPDHARAPGSVLVPWSGSTAVRSVTVVAATVADVGPTTKAAAALADVTGPGDLAVESSTDAVALGGDVSSTVERYAAVIVATVMGAGVLVLGLLSLLMVHGRRQEFGRRRALGAGRGAVIGLVVVQGVMVITVGAVLGAAVGSVVAMALWAQVVDIGLVAALVVATVALAASAQVPSAVLAGLRDPVRVLRTA